MPYLWWKTVHIIGVVSWFAGLFYMVRLFIYHAEARDEVADVRRVLERQYALMERRLFYIITWPALVITTLSAAALLILQPGWLAERWLWIKLGVVALLFLYHGWCQVTMNRFARGAVGWTGQQLRWANEGPTILLIVGVALAVFKELTPLGTLAISLVGISGLFGVSIRLYARLRSRSPAAPDESRPPVHPS